MGVNWKLTVDGFGRIEHADVDVRPLTLFVGENNSGKSYVASLLWGLVAMQGNLEPPQGDLRDACKAWVADRIGPGKGPGKWEIDGETIDRFERLYDATLEANSNRLIERIFNTENVRAKQIEFRNGAKPMSLVLEWDGKAAIGVADYAGEAVYENIGDDIETLQNRALAFVSRRVALGRLHSLLAYFGDGYSVRDPIYLPASRTGYLQLYKKAIRESIRGSFRRDEKQADWSDLTTPSFHFLDLLAFGLKPNTSQEYADEVTLLEHALRGRLELVAGARVNEIMYHCDGASTPLSMNLSSSLVTELAPIILVLRHLNHLPVLVLEEPESHLHPKLQRLLARVIVRLVRKGVFCWITTHSENFCQQINDFVKLGALSPAKRKDAHHKLGYDDYDYLDLDNISGHQFDIDEGGRTQVTELQKTEHGLAMPSFNRELAALGRELDLLNQMLGEDDP